jgi:predicted 2-oxoglutarate/Fe(II)-dependent dioxygenase YbiX
MRAIYHTDKIWTIEKFLSKEECDELIALSEKIGYEEAEVSLESGAKMMKGLRNNYRVIHTDIELASNLWDRLKEYCPLEIEDNYSVGLNEQFRFYKYELDQRFKRHIDGRFKRDGTEESRITFMIYLNEEFDGGETTFDEVNIIPKTGDALCFIHELKHEGCPVKGGIKYALRSDVMYKKK